MIQINYPTQKPAIKSLQGKELIFCAIRKRWYVITPEEWVRQNFILYLIHVLQYPASLIAVEKQITIGAIKRRFDIVVYKNDVPYLVIECKEMNVPLTEQTLTQVLHYNATVNAPYLAITNGNYCKAFLKTDNGMYEIFELPTAATR
ncbi:type I restriction enzyme HsdR N-terminal domain-containing protein [Ferruginibacter yonginensis]|uniref:Type I restriction enzyme HsdR N-terminal domain-containing protein n=1 Tax=Ferruginibacter yonginensis TaxID=1310416 RepID=A0ABV8QV77_9BACT